MADNFAQTVKQQADIVKIIGDYVRLRKAGAQNYTGLCPFHKEKSPSFSVHASQQFYHCFGCKESGDVFAFVMKMDSLTFPEAVRAVALKCGIPLPKREFSSPEEAREAGLRRQLLDLHEAATKYFEQHLQSPEAARAREYLTGRGMEAEIIAKFRIGYAPDDFNTMREAMRKEFSEEALRASGLFSSKEQSETGQPTGQLYARFRKRITFPIANEQGKVIAFTARALDSDEKSGPKYLNSPETPLYSKGHVLFNLDKAKAAIRQHDFALLVEGQMDCISVYTGGIHNVLATSGTAFTEMQVRLLARFTKRIVVNFDPDTAGAAAAEKSIALLTEEDFDVKVVSLEDGLDPDRYIRERGLPAYIEALRTARRYSDYLIQRALQLHPARTPDSQRKAMNYLLPHIRRIPHKLTRENFVSDVRDALKIDSALLFEELRTAAAQRLASVRAHANSPVSETERVLLQALTMSDGHAARALAGEKLSQNPGWMDGLATAALLESLANAVVSSSYDAAQGNPLDLAPDEESRNLLAGVLLQAHESEGDNLEMAVEDALSSLHRRALERRQRELRTLIAEADRKSNQEMVLQLTQELQQLNHTLRSL
ncbi:MAG TPA: DNA primase [Acidobacteriaceae bacterium]